MTSSNQRRYELSFTAKAISCVILYVVIIKVLAVASEQLDLQAATPVLIVLALLLVYPIWKFVIAATYRALAQEWDEAAFHHEESLPLTIANSRILIALDRVCFSLLLSRPDRRSWRPEGQETGTWLGSLRSYCMAIRRCSGNQGRS